MLLVLSQPTKRSQRPSSETEVFKSSSLNPYSEESEDEEVDEVIYFDEANLNDRLKKELKVWDHWGKWSPCTVTCGVGKMTRWRHCVSDACSPGEKEAQIRPCRRQPC